MKLLEENEGITLFDIHLSNTFYNLSPRVREIKAKINKQDLTKPTSAGTAKETVNKTKRQLTD